MAVKINLLPSDYALTGPMGQIVKAARPLSVILLALFLVTAVGMGGFFLYSFFSLTNLTTSNSTLESQIQNQSAAQQQIILLKDRLSQIKTVQTTPDATKSLNNINPLLGLITNNSTLSELDVDPTKTSASVVFKSNSDLTNFLGSIATNSTYSSITMQDFSFNPATGYQLSLDFVGK